jgi:hypothetical protein
MLESRNAESDEIPRNHANMSLQSRNFSRNCGCNCCVVPHNNTIRRDMLRQVTGGVVGIAGLSGFASGQSTGQPQRHIVGTATADATQAAERAADSVHRMLEFGRIGSAVAGVYPDGRLDALRRRSDVRYVEADGLMHAIERDSHTQAPSDNQGPPGGGGAILPRHFHGESTVWMPISLTLSRVMTRFRALPWRVRMSPERVAS